MTRSDSGQFEMKREEVDFEVLSMQVVTGLQPQARKARVTINEEIPVSAPHALYRSPTDEASSEQSRHQCHQIYTT